MKEPKAKTSTMTGQTLSATQPRLHHCKKQWNLVLLEQLNLQDPEEDRDEATSNFDPTLKKDGKKTATDVHSNQWSADDYFYDEFVCLDTDSEENCSNNDETDSEEEEEEGSVAPGAFSHSKPFAISNVTGNSEEKLCHLMGRSYSAQLHRSASLAMPIPRERSQSSDASMLSRYDSDCFYPKNCDFKLSFEARESYEWSASGEKSSPYTHKHPSNNDLLEETDTESSDSCSCDGEEMFQMDGF